MGSIVRGPELAEVYDRVYAAKFEPAELNPMVDLLTELAGADQIPVTVGDMTIAPRA